MDEAKIVETLRFADMLRDKISDNQKIDDRILYFQKKMDKDGMIFVSIYGHDILIPANIILDYLNGTKDTNNLNIEDTVTAISDVAAGEIKHG